MFPGLETVQDWKTVLGGGADGGRGPGRGGGARHHHAEGGLALRPAAGLAAQRLHLGGAGGGAGGVAQVVVVRVAVRQLGPPRPRSLGVGVAAAVAEVGLGGLVAVVLGRGGVGVADGGADLGDVVAIA